MSLMQTEPEPTTTDHEPPVMPIEALQHTIRHSTLRGVGFVGLLAIALIHLLDVISKFDEAPYLGVMYVALMLASLAVAALILHTGSPRAWILAGALAAATLVGFILSRTTGLPGATDDIGNWSEGLGLASMLVEASVIALALYALRLSRSERQPGVHASIVDRATVATRTP